MLRLEAIARVALAAALAVTLSGCFGLPKKEQAAAMVNSEIIAENDVTEYIEGFRFKNDAYTTNDGWASFLSSAGFTASSFRTHVLETVFIPNVLVRQECTARGIAITDDQLDSVIEKEKSYYEQRFGQDSWDSILSSYGYDEQTWRENEELRLLEEQLKETVVDGSTPDKADILSQAQQNGTVYNGKHSYYVSFDSLAAASDAYERVKRNAKAVTLKRLKKVGKVVNAGWNSVAADRDNMSNEYVSALNSIDKGRLNSPVEIDDKHYLIFCDNVFECPADPTYAQLESFPKEICKQIESDAQKALVERKYAEWLEEKTRSSEITIVAMPDGLPYNTNTKLSDAKG